MRRGVDVETFEARTAASAFPSLSAEVDKGFTGEQEIQQEDRIKGSIQAITRRDATCRGRARMALQANGLYP